MNEEMLSGVKELVTAEAFGIWYLIGAALVFFMQAGFAMVETGFTRAKNAGNIIMKNLMDFCIGTVMFIAVGYGLLCGTDIGGFAGKISHTLFTDYGNFSFSSFVFNLVFCATAATIVSGAMAERTKFISYCIYSAVISALIYPIEAHWIWGGGWLVQLGFHDFAGSCAIHMVGGIAALIGAKMLGPRIGKFETDANGKVTKVKAIPGHSLTIGALGCFILWFGWYGFNGAAATDGAQLGSIFLTTTVAPAAATVVCMIFTWLKYGKPDVSMCLNASLAGLVGVTAGCDVVDCFGAAVIGIVSGLLVPFGIWLLDYVLHIDDPVGAVAVHMLNGIWGTIAVGLFADPSVPSYALADADGSQLAGLFYGGGVKLLGLQALAVLTVGVWTAVLITATYFLIKKTIGLRVTAHEEVVGLDIEEHGLASSYSGFLMAVDTESYLAAGEPVPVDKAVELTYEPTAHESFGESEFSQVSIICRQSSFEKLKQSLADIGVEGLTTTQVLGSGKLSKIRSYYRGSPVETTLVPKVKVDVVVCKVPVKEVVETARNALYTGHAGDGKIFVYNVRDVVRVRTGEIGFDALQDNAG
ncbi:MAG: ammonium transporter [Oscillospiraceae bacterium]|nr:ammonium transporter [Oscillospiraceae bacterium]